MAESHPIVQRLARLLSVPPQELIAAAETAPAITADARRALADRRRELAATGEAAASALAARLRPIEARLQAINERRQALRQEESEANAELFDAGAAHAQQLEARERQMRVLEGELRESADPRLAAFATEAQAEIQELCSRWPRGYESFQTTHPLTGSHKTYSNGATLNARIAALRRAVAFVEALKLEPLTAEQIEQQLQALRDALPLVVVELVVA
jgi:hypothetical protein